MNKLAFLCGLPKTIYFNFKYFDLKTALKLPVLVSHNTKIVCAKGKVLITAPIKFGMINIGYSNVEIFDKARSRTIWAVRGEVVFNGIANIGHGSKVTVSASGVLEFGHNFWITAESQIMCHERIKFGEGVLISWQCLLMDTDHHRVLVNDEVVNEDKAIIIGNNVWIACRTTVLKGSRIDDNTVVAATSTVCSSFEQQNCVIAGVPAQIVKENVTWET